MKVLLIDNYDSFTFNVYQYLCELSNCVEVYRNDQITIEEIREGKPDLIVLSPGPKAPKDAGICIEVINTFKGEIPILGICLGHQAINEAFGGETIHAKKLVHGKTSDIISLKKGIMEKMSNFKATRYHSLAVNREKLPSCLEITCQTMDGEIMGIRHKEFMIEGVQFHPESILTEKGKELIAAFMSAIKTNGCVEDQVRHAREKNSVNGTNKKNVRPINIPQKVNIIEAQIPFDTLFSTLYQTYPSKDIFIMDSADGPNVDKEKNIIGLFPKFDISVKKGIMTFKTQDIMLENHFKENLIDLYDVTTNSFILPIDSRFSDVFKLIKLMYQMSQQETTHVYSHGLAGFFSYEYLHQIEKIERSNLADFDIPDIHLTYYSTLIHYCTKEGAMTVFGNLINKEAEKQHEEVLEFLVNMSAISVSTAYIPDGSDIPLDKLAIKLSKEDYLKKVSQAQKYVMDDDIFQVQLGARMEMKITLPIVELYKRLRRISPSPYMFLWEREDIGLIGNSPELQLKIRNQEILSRPIAGTSKGKGHNSEEQEKVISDLINSEKEQAEHIMLVDLARNDISRAAKIGTVEVEKLMEVEEYYNVFHLTSSVVGEISNQADTLALFEDSFPAGTLTGAPKIRAMEIIQELEEHERGPYGGAFGFFDFSGDLISSIIIRTVMKIEDKFTFQASAGIVADSIPEDEWNEIFYKTATIRKVLNQIE